MNMMSGANLRRGLSVVGAVAVLLLVWGMAFASGGGEAAGGHGGGHGSNQMVDLMYRVINFALLVIILFIVVKKTSVKDFFANRREEIKKNFDELNEKKVLAERHYQELEKKLKDFESSRNEILAQYRAEGNAERDRIIAEAEQRSKQIIEQAELTIKREIQSSGERMKREILDSAARQAQEILAREMKDTDQDHLVDEFIKSIEKVEKLH
ncbi:ATP synthase subunit b [uncultured Desulfobacterium sp.]|uniref:ATP synthase subunit b n=1 Tax=uncultured Desulfobacterium sp. TaxID=201089 RepID=A0A445MZF8_9BACT|nr:ATP synthase subunit b [uncultured Desulfobacterium sp.]